MGQNFARLFRTQIPRRGRPSGGTEKELPGYLKVMHDVPTSDSKRDLGLMIDHKKDRAIMDDAREEVPVVKKETNAMKNKGRNREGKARNWTGKTART